MTRLQKILLGFTLLTAAAGVMIEHRAVRQQQLTLAAQDTELARLETSVRDHRRQLADLQRQQAEAERELVAHRQQVALAEASSSMKLWANRITLLKRLLQEMPQRGIPEFRLLSPTDWVQAIRTHELDTAGEIRGAFSRLGAMARKRMTKQLQEALRAYGKDFDGKAPTDIGQLAPYLQPPADLEMLQRYAVVKSAHGAAVPDYLIRESAAGELVMAVGLEKWDISSNPDWKPSDIEAAGVDAAIKQKLATVMAAFDEVGELGNDSAESVLPLPAILQLVMRYAPQAEAAFGPKAAFGDLIKAAVKQYSAANSGRPPATMEDVAPYFGNFEKFTETARPFFAEFKYILDHKGQSPSDPAQLERYLKAPFDPGEILRLMKLTVDGEHVGMNFSFSADAKSP